MLLGRGGAVRLIWTEAAQVPVFGMCVVIPGWEEYKFFLDVRGIDHVITELSSGYQVASGVTKLAAIGKAKKLMDAEGKKAFAAMISKICARNGALNQSQYEAVDTLFA